MQNNLEIGERIRGIRENLHMSREKFSEMIDISDVFLGQIERGERSLSIKTLTKIVDFTGASTDYILFGIDDSSISKTKKILEQYSEMEINEAMKLLNNIAVFIKNQ